MSSHDEIYVFNIKYYTSETFAGSVDYLCTTSMWKNNYTICAGSGEVFGSKIFRSSSIHFVGALLMSFCMRVWICLYLFVLVRLCFCVLLCVRSCLCIFVRIRVCLCM